MVGRGMLVGFLCALVVCFSFFSILCCKRIFLERVFTVCFFIVWIIVTTLQLFYSSFEKTEYLVFSLLLFLIMVCTVTIGNLLKKYLRMVFLSLIELSFDEEVSGPIIILRDTISTYTSKGYTVYVYDTEKIFTYQTIDDITINRHRHIALKLERIKKRRDRVRFKL